MLTSLDDTLWHQLPTTFDHVGTSDPRFFDRYWFACYAPDGSGAVQVTMGAYRNMNVLDAGVAVVSGGRQHNLRASRSLGPEVEPVCGPISVRPTVPLQEFQLAVASDAIRGQVTWRAVLPPAEEKPHFARVRGRVSEDYRRFDQIGVGDGCLELAGERVDINGWWACRDHSWGVRPRMGIREPVTGPPFRLEEQGFAMAFLFFSTESVAGHVHFSRHGDADAYVTGDLQRRDGGPQLAVIDTDLEVELHEDTRRFRACTLAVELAGEDRVTLRCTALGPAIAMQGLGYSGGYHDGAGLGVWRGEQHVEADVWDVSHPSLITYPDGRTGEHWHRIQPVAVEVLDGGKLGGAGRGTGSMTLLLSGHLPQFGLA
jgi:hypothetical protein